MRFVLNNPYLRAIALKTAMANGCDRIMQAVYLLYLSRELKIDPMMIGVLYSSIGAGAVVGAIWGDKLGARIGVGPAIVSASIMGGVASLLFPLAGSVPAATIAILLVGHFFLGMSHPLYNINQVSLRQAITPSNFLGRMNATMRFFVWGTIPLGSLIGGMLGDLVGLRAVLVIGAVGVLLATSWVLFSPLRGLQRIPEGASA